VAKRWQANIRKKRKGLVFETRERKKGTSRLTLQSVPVLETLEELQTPSVPQVKFSVRNAFVPGEKSFFLVAKI